MFYKKQKSVLISGCKGVALAFALVTAGFAHAAEPTARIRIACVGDSITAGGYPAALHKLLGDGYEVLNLGVGGATLMKNGDRPYWRFGKIEAAEKFGPDIVTIMLGTNDAKPQNYHKRPDEFIGDYKAMIAALKGLSSKPKVYVMLPVPVFAPGGFEIDGAVLRKEITPLIVKAAADTQTETIDLFTPLEDAGVMFNDNVHPGDEGGKEIARSIYQAIRGAPFLTVDSKLFIDGAATVTIQPRSKAPVYYTTDGTEPTVASPAYQGPIRLTDTTTVKAIAIGEKTSPVAEIVVTKAVLRPPANVGKTEPGLAFDYFEDDRFCLEYRLDRMKPVRSGVAADFCLAAEQPRKDFWGYRWVGLITVPEDGMYTFYTASDDGSHLWIGTQEVVNNGGEHSVNERSGRIALKAGPQPITLAFFQANKGWSLKVEWEGPGMPRQVIPAAALTHELKSR